MLGYFISAFVPRADMSSLHVSGGHTCLCRNCCHLLDVLPGKLGSVLAPPSRHFVSAGRCRSGQPRHAASNFRASYVVRVAPILMLLLAAPQFSVCTSHLIRLLSCSPDVAISAVARPLSTLPPHPPLEPTAQHGQPPSHNIAHISCPVAPCYLILYTLHLERKDQPRCSQLLRVSCCITNELHVSTAACHDPLHIPSPASPREAPRRLSTRIFPPMNCAPLSPRLATLP